MKSFVFTVTAVLVSFVGIVLLSAGPSDQETEEAVASWKQEASIYSKADLEYMRRNGAFKK